MFKRFVTLLSESEIDYALATVVSTNSNQHIACERLWPGTVNVDPCWKEWCFICLNASAHLPLHLVWFDHRQSALRWNDMLSKDRNNGWSLVGVYACHGCEVASLLLIDKLVASYCASARRLSQALTSPIRVNAATRRCGIMSCLRFITLLSKSEID